MEEDSKRKEMCSILLSSVKKGDDKMVERLIKEDLSLINETDQMGWNSVHFCIFYKQGLMLE